MLDLNHLHTLTRSRRWSRVQLWSKWGLMISLQRLSRMWPTSVMKENFKSWLNRLLENGLTFWSYILFHPKLVSRFLLHAMLRSQLLPRKLWSQFWVWGHRTQQWPEQIHCWSISGGQPKNFRDILLCKKSVLGDTFNSCRNPEVQQPRGQASCLHWDMQNMFSAIHVLMRWLVAEEFLVHATFSTPAKGLWSKHLSFRFPRCLNSTDFWKMQVETKRIELSWHTSSLLSTRGAGTQICAGCGV